MEEQSYAKHAKFVPMYHLATFGLIVVTLIGSLVNLYYSIGDHSRLNNASLVMALAVEMLLLFFFVRIFPLKAQDRAIRGGESSALCAYRKLAGFSADDQRDHRSPFCILE